MASVAVSCGWGTTEDTEYGFSCGVPEELSVYSVPVRAGYSVVNIGVLRLGGPRKTRKTRKMATVAMCQRGFPCILCILWLISVCCG
jgi:hypothetical protein